MWLIIFTLCALGLLLAIYVGQRAYSRKRAMKLSLGYGVGVRVERPPAKYAPVDNSDRDKMFTCEAPTTSTLHLNRNHLSGYAGEAAAPLSSSSSGEEDEADDSLDIDMSSELTEKEVELALENYLNVDVDVEKGTPPKLAPPPSA